MAAAGLWETWTTRLRLAWMGPTAQRIMGGFAAVLADRSAADSDAAVKMRMPQKAGDPAVLPLIGSSRLLDQGPPGTDTDYANRLVNWIQQWGFAGTPLGVLIALHWAGFDNAVIVQQNGLAFQLTLPLPTPGPGWDPTPNLTVTSCSQLAMDLTSIVTPTHSAPNGHAWFMFDADTDACSRFAVLFPGTLPPAFMTTGRATFTGSDTATVTWSNIFADTTYLVAPGPVVGSSSVVVAVDGTSLTTGAATLRASAPFTGYCDVMAWQAGANPLADLHPADLQRLQSAIKQWRPAKARCVGVYAVAQGKFMSWPPQAQSTNTMGPFSIARFDGA
jgi:hypothetical protein